MALLPGLSLQVQPVNIPTPDFGRTMLQAAQLKDLMQQQQVRQLAVQDVMLQREREQALQAYMAAQMAQAEAGTVPLSQLASAPGTRPLIHGPTQALWQGGEAASPAAAQRMAAGPGTTYQRTEVTPQAPPVPARRSGGGMRLTDQLDWRKMYALDPKRGLEIFNTVRQMEQGDALTQMKVLSGGIGFLDEILATVVDQDSLDKGRATLEDLPQIGPKLADLLPETYDAALIDQRRRQLVPMKQRVQGMQAGLNPIWGKDAQGNYTTTQLTPSGAAVQTQYPQGFTPLPPTKPLDVGTGYVPVGPGGTTVGAPITKNVREAETEKQIGQETGTYEGKLPQMERQARATLDQIDKKHQLVGQEIDKALNIITTSTLPTTGVMGNFLKSFYQPGRDLASLITTIGANIGLDELQSLRQAGSTLGQVTEAEHRLLQSVLGSLEQAQSQEQFTGNLTRLKTTLAQVKQRREQAYKEEFQSKGVSSTPTQKVMTEQQVRELAQRRGLSEADVRQRAQASGYRITP